jgi:stage V sporulation protein B
LVVPLTDLGVSTAVAKHVAESISRGEDHTKIIFSGLILKVTLAAFSAAAIVLLSEPLSSLLFKSGSYAGAIWLVGVDIALLVSNTIVTNSLLGLSNILAMATLSVISAFVRQSMAIAFLTTGYGLQGYVLGWVSGDVVYAVVGILILLVARDLKVHSIASVSRTLRVLLRFSWPLYLSGIASFVYSTLDRMILLAYLPLAEAGVYQVAYTGFSMLTTVPAAISTVLLPFYARLRGMNDPENVKKGARYASRYVSLVYSPIGLGAAAVARPALSLLAGRRYAVGDLPLSTLSLFSVLTCSGAVLGGILLSYDMTLSVLLINLASVATGITISVVLVPEFGILGTALTQGASMITSFLLTLILLRRKKGIELETGSILKSFLSAMIMAATVAVVELLWFDERLLLLYIGVGILTYAVLVRMFKLTRPEDFDLAHQILGGRVSRIVDTIESLLT